MNRLPTNPATGSAETPAPGSQPTSARRRQILSGVALATGLVVGGTAVAAATSNTATIARPGGDDARGGQHGQGMPGGMRDGMRGGLHGALHGELTVPQADGIGTEVILVQRGAVTAVSSTSLSVKSTDGFTSTYKVSSSTRVRAAGGDTIGAVKVGAQVHVVSTKDKAALMVRGERMDGRRGGNHMRPSPSPSATSGT